MGRRTKAGATAPHSSATGNSPITFHQRDDGVMTQHHTGARRQEQVGTRELPNPDAWLTPGVAPGRRVKTDPRRGSSCAVHLKRHERRESRRQNWTGPKPAQNTQERFPRNSLGGLLEKSADPKVGHQSAPVGREAHENLKRTAALKDSPKTRTLGM